MGFFNKTSTTTKLEPMKEKWQLDTGEAIAKMAQKGIAKYDPGVGYSGKFTAGNTPFEKQSLDILNQYMGDPNRQALLGAGQQQLLDTMSGKFMDPSQSPYLKAMERIGKRQLGEQIDVSRRARGAGPNFFHTQTGAEEGKLRGNYLDTLAAITGKFMGDERTQERTRGLEAARSAIGAGDPLKAIGAGQSFGALNRVINQSDMDKRYQDWLEGRNELQGAVGAGQNVFGTNIDYGVKSFTKEGASPFSKVMEIAGPAIIGAMTGGAGLAGGALLKGAGLGAIKGVASRY